MYKKLFEKQIYDLEILKAIIEYLLSYSLHISPKQWTKNVEIAIKTV